MEPPFRRPIPEAFGVVLGSDSLTTPRAGIGRVTFELACQLRHHPAVADLRLWMDGRLHGVEAIDQLGPDDSSGTPNPRHRRAIGRPLRILVGRLPAVQPLRAHLATRRLAREFDEIRQSSGRLIYFEPNMIAKPFPGITVPQIHDLSWFHHPELHPADRIEWIGRHLDRTLRQASRFVAVSDFTARELIRELGVAADRVDVVPNAPSPMFQPRSAQQAARTLADLGLSDRRYVLSVSTLEPRKNFDRLLSAHASLPVALRSRYPLVIAGADGWGVTLQNRAAEAARREGTLRLLGRLSDDALVAVTARAAVLAYVSLYEGFGLPVVESMAAGTPVLASSTTAVGETAADAAYLVQPLDVADITAGLHAVLDDAGLSEALIRRGHARAAHFTWRRAAEGIVASWRRAAS